MPHATEGVTVKSDEATIIYLLHFDGQQRPLNRFIIRQLDSRTLLVRPNRLRSVNAVLAHRLNETVFDEEEEAAAAAAAGKA